MKESDGPHMPLREDLGDDVERNIREAIDTERRAKRIADLFILVLFLTLIMVAAF